jgi:radical SAM protein with 4Fe4S-binding SPASM domain
MPSLKRTIDYSAALLRHRPKGWKSVVYNTAMAKIGRVGPLMMPAHISIEPTNVCNARCPVCETGNGSLSRSSGFLEYDNFTSLIDDVEATTSVLMFYFMGEPFLNRRAYEMIRYARSKGIFVETCTNGDFVSAEGVVYSDVNQISFQIGGLDNETHEKYRVRSRFDRVEKNLGELIALRSKHPESQVRVEVGFIVMRHNEHQVQDFLAWAKDLGVDKAIVVDPCVRTVEEGSQFLTKDEAYWFYDAEAFKKGVLRPKVIPENECTWVWNSTMINWNGDVVPCCRDPHGQYLLGNAFEEPLRRVWNSEKSREFRRGISTNQSQVGICALCSGYGVPRLHRAETVGFKVEHHTVNDPDLDNLLTGAPVQLSPKRKAAG